MTQPDFVVAATPLKAFLFVFILYSDRNLLSLPCVKTVSVNMEMLYNISFPLQIPQGFQAVFSLVSVRPPDARNPDQTRSGHQVLLHRLPGPSSHYPEWYIRIPIFHTKTLTVSSLFQTPNGRSCTLVLALLSTIELAVSLCLFLPLSLPILFMNYFQCKLIQRPSLLVFRWLPLRRTETSLVHILNEELLIRQ